MSVQSGYYNRAGFIVRDCGTLKNVYKIGMWPLLISNSEPPPTETTNYIILSVPVPLKLVVNHDLSWQKPFGIEFDIYQGCNHKA